jgi:hypothetical protein
MEIAASVIVNAQNPNHHFTLSLPAPSNPLRVPVTVPSLCGCLPGEPTSFCRHRGAQPAAWGRRCDRLCGVAKPTCSVHGPELPGRCGPVSRCPVGRQQLVGPETPVSSPYHQCDPEHRHVGPTTVPRKPRPRQPGHRPGTPTRRPQATGSPDTPGAPATGRRDRHNGRGSLAQGNWERADRSAAPSSIPARSGTLTSARATWPPLHSPMPPCGHTLGYG